MKLMYPGYILEGGTYRDKDIWETTGGVGSYLIDHIHNTAPLRLSMVLNQYAGRHSIGIRCPKWPLGSATLWSASRFRRP